MHQECLKNNSDLSAYDKGIMNYVLSELNIADCTMSGRTLDYCHWTDIPFAWINYFSLMEDLETKGKRWATINLIGLVFRKADSNRSEMKIYLNDKSDIKYNSLISQLCSNVITILYYIFKYLL